MFATVVCGDEIIVKGIVNGSRPKEEKIHDRIDRAAKYFRAAKYCWVSQPSIIHKL